MSDSRNNEKPLTFVAVDGSMIIMLSSMPMEGEVFYRASNSENPPHALAGMWGMASNIPGSLKLELNSYDPVHDVHRKINRLNDVITCDGIEYMLNNDVSINIAEATPLPLTRETEYLSQTTNGDLILVSRKKYCWDYDSFKLFIGPVGATMREIAVEEVERFRDGGTTHVYTGEGTFTCPTPLTTRLSKFSSRTWPDKNVKVTSLSIDLYDIHESPEGHAIINLRAAI